MSRAFDAIAAMDEERGIGIDDRLPWRLPGDMDYYKRVTRTAPAGLCNAVVMGRKTYESIPAKFRPLPGRLNVVLTRNPDYGLPEDVLRASSLDHALAQLDARADVYRTFVAGGADVYAQALEHPGCGRLYLTRIHARFACDAFFPPFEHAYRLIERDGPHREGALTYTFEVHDRNH